MKKRSLRITGQHIDLTQETRARNCANEWACWGSVKVVSE